MKPPLDASRAGSEAEEIERQLAKLTKINAALMQRVEKSMDQQANAFSLFQTAITLEGQVRVRTDELKTALSRLERTNDELTTARDTSERANRFKTRFFTAVGHDLLQPLHAARLSVSALTDPSSTPDQRRLADRVEHALTTIEDLLKSILDISKLEAGAIVPTLRAVPLDELFASLTLGIEPLARLKKLALTWRRTDVAVVSDPLMLRRILQNLLTNAVQYTERGGIKLAARRRGPLVRIEVWDTGPGIATADQVMIFDEFQRGPIPDRLSIGGFGLGLSIVRRMAETLDHPLGLCSRMGHGTRFSITAPFAGTVDSTAERTPPVSCNATYGLNGAKVLVIDNDEAVVGGHAVSAPALDVQGRAGARSGRARSLHRRWRAPRHHARRLPPRSRRLRRCCHRAAARRGRRSRAAGGHHHGRPFSDCRRQGTRGWLRAALEAGEAGRAARMMHHLVRPLAAALGD